MSRARLTAGRRLVLAAAAVLLAVCTAVSVAAVELPSSGRATSAAPPPPPLVLPERAQVLILGDSWTYGTAATRPGLGYAYRLASMEHWDAQISGLRGSGYLRTGLDGPAFGRHFAVLDVTIDPDLIIVEGSINDRRSDLGLYPAAVNTAWDMLAARFPEAQIVILGPAPQVLPVERATARIDTILAGLAQERSWWYISPIAEQWITPQNYRALIDTSELGGNHPSNDGHLYLAHRVAQALTGISAQGPQLDAVTPAPALPLPAPSTPAPERSRPGS